MAIGYHHVEDVMGMAVSIDVRDEVIGTPGLHEVVAWLHHVDETFSVYRDDSPISRLGRGEMQLDDVDDEVRSVLLQCEAIRYDTAGAFDALAVPAANGTTLDPSGLVKGWAIEHAARLLETSGLTSFCINAGGDIAIRGRPMPDPMWRVGIRHPDEPDLLAAVLEVAGPVAIATSATYERGAHIIDPRSGCPTTEVASVTVIGTDLGLTDAYATAVFVMGIDGLEWLARHPGYDGFLVTHDRTTLSTPNMARWRVG
jgi:thiamine biosynthesis lipoprotein